MDHQDALRRLRESLAEAQRGSLGAAELGRLWRAEGALLAALPPRYGEVLDALLSRVESGSLFGEESCSFSLQDLQASLGTWLDKAGAVLAARA